MCDTIGINRTEIEEFIRSKMNVQPSEAHLDLCRIRWQAIFTTNYDDLIETAYRIALKKLKIDVTQFLVGFFHAPNLTIWKLFVYSN